MKNLFLSDKVPWIVSLFCVSLLFITGFVAINSIQNNWDNQIQIYQDGGRRLATAIDHDLKIQSITLEILGAEAQSIIAGDKISQHITTSDLLPTENPQGYILSVSTGVKEGQIGSLSGLGEIPAVGTSLAKELDMALGLSPAFEQVIKNNTALPWVYYTSAHQFIYMYPQISTDEFFYSDILLETDFFKIATPENDPERKLVWSDPYEDQAGAGQMITLSKPIYDGDHFLGVLSIDTLTSYIRWLLESNMIEDVNSYLITQNGVGIVGVVDNNQNYDISLIQSETEIVSDHLIYMFFPLNEVNWYVVFEVEKSLLLKNAIEKSTNEVIIFLFIVFNTVIIYIIYRNMRSARFMAIHDNLTGVLNRRSFDELSIRTLQKSNPTNSFLGAVIVDIDLFKKYNDTYGHVAGDETLRQVAKAISNCLRSSNDHVFRIGGEEFLVLFTLSSPDDMPQIMFRMLNAVRLLNIPHSQSPFGYVTISAGAMVCKMNEVKSLEEVSKRADNALYIAKDSGRNCWHLA